MPNQYKTTKEDKWLVTENTNARFVGIFTMKRKAIQIQALSLAPYGKTFQTIGVAQSAAWKKVILS
jgi:hypothetical protein